MLSSNWNFFIIVASLISSFIFAMISIFLIDELKIDFINFKYTDKLLKDIKRTFTFIIIIASICIYLFFYTLDFMISEEYNIIEENKIEFFYDYSNSSLYEILYGNQENIGYYNFMLKNDKKELYTKNYCKNNVEKIYKNIEQPYIIEIKAQRKNFLYHYDFIITQLILPIKFKE